jgi:hypothetical protein
MTLATGRGSVSGPLSNLVRPRGTEVTVKNLSLAEVKALDLRVGRRDDGMVAGPAEVVSAATERRHIV